MNLLRGHTETRIFDLRSKTLAMRKSKPKTTVYGDHSVSAKLALYERFKTRVNGFTPPIWEGPEPT